MTATSATACSYPEATDGNHVCRLLSWRGTVPSLINAKSEALQMLSRLRRICRELSPVPNDNHVDSRPEEGQAACEFQHVFFHCVGDDRVRPR